VNANSELVYETNETEGKSEAQKERKRMTLGGKKRKKNG
jgi:hypothetical protein